MRYTFSRGLVVKMLCLSPALSLLVGHAIAVPSSEHFVASSLHRPGTVAMKFLFGGADAGTNTYTTNPDGTFTSESKLSLAGMSIESKLSGKVVNGALVEFEMHEKRSQPSLEYTLSAKDGKFKATSGKDSKEGNYTPPKAYFANFHAPLSATIAKAYDFTKGGAQDIDVFVLEALSNVKVNVTLKRTTPMTVGGEKKVVQVFHVRFNALVEMDIGILENGPAVLWDVPSQMFKAVANGYEELAADPVAKYTELSQPTFKVKTEKGVKTPMRDGVNLVADVARPDTAGKFPVILIRTPYGRVPSIAQGDWWAKRGYVLVSQDVRGRFDSEGDFDPFMHERKDGYDTLEWLTKQPWCDGNVGMIGGSYLGYVQWCAAAEGHPALKAIVPQVSPPDMFFNFPYDHGVYFLYGSVWWGAVVKERGSVNVELNGMDNADKFTTLPLSKVDEAVLGKDLPFYNRWLERTTWSSFKDANYYEDMAKVKIPALMISGWWDGDGIGTKINWARMRELGRTNQWLIYGPWTHFFNSTTRLGDTDYGPDAVLELDSLYLRWFDTWLKGRSVGLEKVPHVKVFVTGANEWREFSDWPDPKSSEKVFYLGNTGPANGNTSMGTLTETKQPKDAEPDRYTYNPASVSVKKEDTDIEKVSTKVTLEEKRDDVLIFKSAPLANDLDIGGPISADIYFSTSAKDADFFVGLVDIEEKEVSAKNSPRPDERRGEGAGGEGSASVQGQKIVEMRKIGISGKIRGSYLSGWDKPQPLTPGKVYKARIDLWDVAHRFKKGHRVGLILVSNGFPAYARNLGTGEPIATATRMVAANQTIYHDANRPSSLSFRVLPKKN